LFFRVENSSSITVFTRITGTLHSLKHFAEFYLESEVFQTNVVEKIETYILCAKTFFFPKIVPCMIYCDNMCLCILIVRPYILIYVYLLLSRYS